MSQKITLNAVTCILNGGKATTIMVKAGPISLATATLGGKWNEQNALKELKKSPKRFKIINNDAKTILNSFGIAI